MADEQKSQRGWLGGVAGAVVVALLAGGSAPWWWELIRPEPKADVSHAVTNGPANSAIVEPPLASPARALGATEVPKTNETPDTVNHLEPKQVLKGAHSEALVSTSGYFRAVIQPDCNFVVYQVSRPVWASDTQGRGSACSAVMQADGNVVVYNEEGVAVWAAGTDGNPGANVVMQDDGNLVIYSAGRALWATDTSVNVGHR